MANLDSEGFGNTVGASAGQKKTLNKAGDAVSWITDPLDLFGARRGKRAAQEQMAAQEKAYAAKQQLFDAAGNRIAGTQDSSLGAIAGGEQYGASSLQDMYSQGQGFYGKGADALQGGLQGAMGQIYGGAQNVTGQKFLSKDVYGQIGAPVDLEADPGYQFRLQQGEQAINRAASAAGGRMSGATLKALAAHGQNLASQEYGAAFQREQDVNALRLQAGSSVDQMKQAARFNQAGRADNMAQFGAGLQMQGGQNLAGLYQNQAGAAAAQGQSLADLYSNAANARVGAYQFAGQQGMGLMDAQSQAEDARAGVAGMDTQAAANAQKGKTNTISSFFGGMMGKSDARLKSDIETIPDSIYERAGLRGVRWKWRPEAKQFGLEGEDFGVIAQEVQELYPNLIRERDGYLEVDYAGLHRLVEKVA